MLQGGEKLTITTTSKRVWSFRLFCYMADPQGCNAAWKLKSDHSNDSKKSVVFFYYPCSMADPQGCNAARKLRTE
jgi:hypothetical protein